MTKNDEQLIKDANHLYCVDWYLADQMAKKQTRKKPKTNYRTLQKDYTIKKNI